MTDRITAEQLAELKAALAKAANGEWTVRRLNEDSGTRYEGPLVVYSDDDCEFHPISDCSCNHSCRDDADTAANAAFIALAHNRMAALIAAAEEAEKAARDAGEDAFFAGKRAGIEAAAAIFDRHASEVAESLDWLRQRGQTNAELWREHARTIADAKSIRALIEKEKADG